MITILRAYFGDWKILIGRVNEALQRIGADWKIEHSDVTFLA